MNSNKIPIHSTNDFKGMRKAGLLTAKILDELQNIIVPGISTDEINTFCHQMIIKNNAIPAPLHYKGFPKSICTSVNHVVCHGIPNKNKNLQDGDIVNVDVTVILDGWHGDSSRMFVAGKINKKKNYYLKRHMNVFSWVSKMLNLVNILVTLVMKYKNMRIPEIFQLLEIFVVTV